MGFFSAIGSLFGRKTSKEKKAEQAQRNALANRSFAVNTDPYGGVKPLKSLKETPEGALFAKKIAGRAEGKGVGYDRNAISRVTGAFGARRRATLREEELPVISQQASARGLGRSTIPINRAALATQAAERDIEERAANLNLVNEQQKRAEINAALGDLFGFSQAEANQIASRANFDYADFQRLNAAKERLAMLENEKREGRATLETQQAAADAKRQVAGLQNAIKVAVGAATGFVGGGVSGAFMGAGNSLTSSTAGITNSIASIDQILSSRANTPVSTGGISGFNPSPLASLPSIMGGLR